MKTKSSSTKIKIPTLMRPDKNNVSISLLNCSVRIDPSTGLMQVSGISDFVLKETA